MAVLLLNNCEGISNGTTVTTGNSGGTSGTAWDLVSVGASSTLTSDNTHAAHGTQAYKSVLGATNTNNTEWSTAFGTQTDYWVRIYIWASSFSQARRVAYGRNGASNAWSLQIDTSGHVLLINSAGATVYTSTATLTTSAWQRIELHVTHATGSTGAVRALIYKTQDATSADEDVTTSSLSVLTQATLVDFGQNSTAFASNTYWYDDMGVATAGQLGPFVSNTVAPTISGSAPVGSTLTSGNGTWTGINQAFTYQWTRAGSNIGAATSSTYVTVDADIGSAIGCKVACTNSVTTESGAAAVASSNTVTPTAINPVNTVAPVVSGTTQVGSTLSTTNGTWTGDPTPTFTYQWQRDTGGNLSFSNIGAATANTYLLVSADNGNKVRCVVTGTNSGAAVAGNSNAVGLITNPSAGGTAINMTLVGAG